MSSLQRKICVNYLRGQCDNQLKCQLFHPVKLRDFYSHWTSTIDDYAHSFSIKANSIGFDKSNKKKIRSEFFTLIKNLSIYKHQVHELRLCVFDIEYPHYEDPMYDDECYDKIFYSLHDFKYLRSFEISLGGLFPLMQCKKSFEHLLASLPSLKKLTIELQSNKDDRIKNDFDYNYVLDVLVKQRQLSSLNVRINIPSAKDWLLFNFLIESSAEEVCLELKNLCQIKIMNQKYTRGIWFNVVKEGEMNRDPLKIMEEIRRVLYKEMQSFSSFKYELDETVIEDWNFYPVKKRRQETGQFFKHWLNCFNFDKMQLSEIDLKFSQLFLKVPENLEFFIRNSLLKLNKLRKVKLSASHSCLSEIGVTDMVKFLKRNNDSLISLSIQEFELHVKWPELQNFLETFLKMKQLINLEIFVLDLKANFQANNSILQEMFLKFLLSAPYLINLNFGLRFLDLIIGGLSPEYLFFIMRKKKFAMQIMALKRKGKYRNVRKEIIIDIFWKSTIKNKPFKALPKEIFKFPHSHPRLNRVPQFMGLEGEDEVWE